MVVGSEWRGNRVSEEPGGLLWRELSQEVMTVARVPWSQEFPVNRGDLHYRILHATRICVWSSPGDTRQDRTPVPASQRARWYSDGHTANQSI